MHWLVLQSSRGVPKDSLLSLLPAPILVCASEFCGPAQCDSPRSPPSCMQVLWPTQMNYPLHPTTHHPCPSPRILTKSTPKHDFHTHQLAFQHSLSQPSSISCEHRQVAWLDPRRPLEFSFLSTPSPLLSVSASRPWKPPEIILHMLNKSSVVPF